MHIYSSIYDVYIGLRDLSVSTYWKVILRIYLTPAWKNITKKLAMSIHTIKDIDKNNLIVQKKLLTCLYFVLSRVITWGIYYIVHFSIISPSISFPQRRQEKPTTKGGGVKAGSLRKNNLIWSSTKKSSERMTTKLEGGGGWP